MQHNKKMESSRRANGDQASGESTASQRGETNLDVSSGLRYTHRAPISAQKEHDGLAASHRVFRDRHTSHATLTRFLG